MNVVERHLCTILAVRIEGVGALFASPHAAETKRAAEMHSRLADVVARHNGVERAGGADLFLADFGSSTDALAATLALRQAHAAGDADAECPHRFALSIGEVTVDGQHICGEAVQIAVGLIEQARDGGAVLSYAAYEQLRDRGDVGFASIGEYTLPQVIRPIEVYRLDASGQARSLTDIVSELGRRRVIRTAGAYVVVAWLLVQAGDIVLEAFEAPTWVQRTLITLLAAGFPLVMLLTWSLNLSAEGLVRTPDTGYSKRVGHWLKRSVIGASIALAAGVLWAVWAGMAASLGEPAVPTVRQPAAREVPANPTVIVAPLQQVGDDATLARLGASVSNLIRDSLVDTGHAIVFSRLALDTLTPAGSGELATTTRFDGADYLVTGDYFRTAGGLTVQTRITDLANGRIIGRRKIRGEDISDVLEQVAVLTRGLKFQLGLPTENSVGHLAADIAASDPVAYELYVSGLEYLSLFDYVNAEELLSAALERAPDFGIAQYRLAQIRAANGEHDRAYAMLEQIDTGNLSRRETFFVEGAKHKFDAHRDLPRAIEIYRELVAEYPFDSESLQNLAETYYLDFQDQASMSVLERLVSLHPREYVSWMALGERQLDVGLNAEAGKSLETYIEMRPEDPYAHALLGKLHAAHGDWPKALSAYDVALSLQSDMGIARLGRARTLFIVGETAAALQTWQSLLDDASAGANDRIDAALDIAAAYRAQNDYARAIETLTDAHGLAQTTRTVWLTAARLGQLQAQTGNLAAAAAHFQTAIDATPADREPIRPLFFWCLAAIEAGDDLANSEPVRRLRTLAPEAEPDRIDWLATLAVVQSLRTSGDDAVRLARQALDAEAYPYIAYERVLAEAYVAAGDPGSARTLLSRWLATVPSLDRIDLAYDRIRGERLLTRLTDGTTVADERRPLLPVDAD